MKELSDITCCFFDSEGLYYALAKKLSQSYKRLLYVDTSEEAFPTVNAAVIGDSYPDNDRFERVDDFWLVKKEVDLFVFPDSKQAGLQYELSAQGFPVWGSRSASVLEQSRDTFLTVLQKLGFEIPAYRRVVGLAALADYLHDKQNQIIKISRFRGTMETKKWRDWDEDEAWLDLMAVRLGGVKDIWPFLVFESIDTDLEIGADTYCVNGAFPELIIGGTETKDRAYIGEIKTKAELPGETQALLEAFAPILQHTGHANFWSMEIRVKGEHFYFVDPTPRAPLPGMASQMEMYSNLPMIIAAGAEGELLNPEPVGKFSMECALTIKSEKHMWPSVRIPEQITRWVKLASVTKVNGRYWFPPLPNDHGTEVGWLVALGDTIEEALANLHDYAAMLPDSVEAHTEGLADTLRDIESANKKGVTFTDAKIPEPQEAIPD